MCLEIRGQFIVPYLVTSCAICQSKQIVRLDTFLSDFQRHFSHLFIFIFGPVGFRNSGIQVHIPSLHTLQFRPPLSMKQTTDLKRKESTLKTFYNLFSISHTHRQKTGNGFPIGFPKVVCKDFKVFILHPKRLH